MGNNLNVLGLSKYFLYILLGLYTKLICSIVLKLIAFNDIISKIDINFPRD